VGGILSGFFGGLSGIQGAIRSAFLVKSGLKKEAYIATGVVIACFVDINGFRCMHRGLRPPVLTRTLDYWLPQHQLLLLVLLLANGC
jgi:hypothetical protein